MRAGVVIVSLALAVPLSGCAFFMRGVADASYPVARSQAQAMFSQGDLAKAKQAGGQIQLLESLADADPDNDAYSVLAAQLIGGYAFGFVDPVVGPYDVPDPGKIAQAKAFYLKGMAYGMRPLLRHPEFAAARGEAIDAFRQALAGFGRQDVPALFWCAYNWGQLINISRDDPFWVAQLPRVSALMHRVEALDPAYYHGGAYVYDMVNDASRPPLLGGDPSKAKAAYDKARSIDDGRFLTTDVMFAQNYCVQTQDAVLFKALLSHVIAAPDDILPSEQLANALARRRAAILLSKIDDFFPELDDAASDPATGSLSPDFQPPSIASPDAEPRGIMQPDTQPPGVASPDTEPAIVR